MVRQCAAVISSVSPTSQGVFVTLAGSYEPVEIKRKLFIRRQHTKSFETRSRGIAL
jgi:hypothetical protein